MEKIASFTVHHLNLFPGVYVSRKDSCGSGTVTTFDLRFTAPNREPVIDMPALHTIEHLGATWFRTVSDVADKVIYFGPMGCRTGFYLLLSGDLSSEDVLPYVTELCRFIIGFEGEIPGAKPDECGNWSEQNLGMAKYYAEKYLAELTGHKRTEYPDD